MFERAGEKIKNWATTSFYVETIIYVIGAIAMWIVSINDGVDYIWGGFVLLIFGPLSAYFTSLLLYGFGELVDTNKKQLEITKMEKEVFSNEELPEL